MPLHALLLSSALVAAALDGAAAPQKPHHMILEAPAEPLQFASDEISGSVIELDVVGTGLVILIGGLLWLFRPGAPAPQRLPFRDARSFDVATPERRLQQ